MAGLILPESGLRLKVLASTKRGQDSRCDSRNGGDLAMEDRDEKAVSAVSRLRLRPERDSD